MAITIFKNESSQVLSFLVQVRNKAIPLVGCKVIFDMVSKKDNTRLGGGECEILDAGAGLVKYTFKDIEVALEGEYQGKLIIDMAQGARREGLALDLQVIQR